MTPKDAQQRRKILRFWDKHGLPATLDAFGVSRRTLYRWKARLAAEAGNPAALAAKSCAPKHKRTPKTDPRLVAEMRRLRKLHPNLGKDKLHVLLAPWCRRHGVALPSVSTLGRIIARAPDKMRYAPVRIDRQGRPKPLRRTIQPRKPKDLKAAPMTLWAVDTIERVRDGMRRYLLTLIDPVSAIAFAVALPSKHSHHTAKAAQALIASLESHPRLMVLSDHGSEFKGAFDATLQRLGLTHYWTYPKSPKMNAHVERFNRTVQESFVDFHEDLLFTDLGLFNQKLADWLVFYNTQRPHHRLNQQPPLQSLLQHHPECQRFLNLCSRRGPCSRSGC